MGVEVPPAAEKEEREKGPGDLWCIVSLFLQWLYLLDSFKTSKQVHQPSLPDVDLISELGSRFQELSHGLIQVASKAAETHHSTYLLKRRTNEIMKEVEEDLRKSSQNCQDDDMQNEVESISIVEAAKGFKRRGKKTVGGKPQKRWIGVLEKRSRGQSCLTSRQTCATVRRIELNVGTLICAPVAVGASLVVAAATGVSKRVKGGQCRCSE
ncbi:hypothetical protein QJS10_CPB22g00736 [Acorus calamus]|uniref:Uncharacterized protein n=1 Tax=Acorus calamus TaxID=4465 RepID=A0AAV9C0W0_ACOCL|nr:hypothetical protein QJS10_CPB22g00736 [Acorus calamus]